MDGQLVAGGHFVEVGDGLQGDPDGVDSDRCGFRSSDPKTLEPSGDECQTRKGLAAYKFDGTLDSNWDPALEGQYNLAWALHVDTLNRLHVGGEFLTVNGIKQHNYTRLSSQDTTLPTVSGVAPTEGATDVAATANAEVTFSEAMDPNTINTTTFTLAKQGTTTPAAATVIYDSAGKKATLNPDVDLEAGTTYTATVMGGATGVKDLASNPLAGDKTWSFSTATLLPPADTTAPETTIDSGPSGAVSASSASFAFSSSEANSTFECSFDGGTFASCTSPKSYVDLSDGSHTFSVRATDAAGNIDSTAAERRWDIDTVAPTANPPVRSLVVGSTLGTPTVPVKLDWSATDQGSGVAQYQVQVSVNGGAYADVALPSATTTSLTRSLEPSKSYSHRVRAQDRAGNWSAWAPGASFTVDLRQENYQTVSYTGTWVLQALSTASGGYVKYASASGSKAKFSFTGRTIAWVAPKGADKGKAEVWIDGVKAATVDLYASSSQTRKMVFTKSWATSGTHTLEVRATNTKNASSSGARVDVDAFVALR
jgi:hypothetical protein